MSRSFHGRMEASLRSRSWTEITDLPQLSIEKMTGSLLESTAASNLHAKCFTHSERAIMLVAIVGPMWSGKSDVLIQELRHQAENNAHNVTAFSSVVNTRDLDRISSRSGKSFPCERITDQQASPDREDKRSIEGMIDLGMTVGVDEGQFFVNLIYAGIISRAQAYQYVFIRWKIQPA